MTDYLEPIDHAQPGYGDIWDELPLWSAPFGMLLLGRVPMRPGMTILDVGAGTGFLSIELAQRCGRDSQVIAVDPWQAGVERLRSKLDRLGLENVLLIEDDAMRLQLDDETVDLIVSNLGINNFADPAAVLRVCFRVARPGADLLLTTNLIGHMQELYEVFEKTLKELGQSDRLGALDEHVAHRGTPETVATLLTDAGFVVGTVTHESFQMRFASGSALLRHRLLRIGFVPAWKAIPDPARLVETFDLFEKKLNELAAETGGLSLTIPVACFEARK